MHSATNTAIETNSPDEDHFRAGTYSLLAGLLVGPPDQTLMQRLRAIDTEANTPIGDAEPHAHASDKAASDTTGSSLPLAWARLGQMAAAETVTDDSLDDEYHALFLGVGRGELVPFGSWYITGFLMEKPLSALRQDLNRLGYERQAGVHEPEDHVAALCEVMADLITAIDVPFATQRQFFERHMGPWMEAFFSDLQQAKSARFYRAVGHLGLAFIRTEKQALSMLV